MWGDLRDWWESTYALRNTVDNIYCCSADASAWVGGEAGIRTLDTAFRPYNGLANRRLQPLGHLTVSKLLRILRVFLAGTGYGRASVPTSVPQADAQPPAGLRR